MQLESIGPSKVSCAKDRGIVDVCPYAGKLKDLGNTILGKFGMSTNDFECVKDPNTGSFSIGMKKK